MYIFTYLLIYWGFLPTRVKYNISCAPKNLLGNIFKQTYTEETVRPISVVSAVQLRRGPVATSPGQGPVGTRR